MRIFRYFTHGIKDDYPRSKKYVAKGIYTLGLEEKVIVENMAQNHKLTPKKAIPFKSNNTLLLVFDQSVKGSKMYKIRSILYHRLKIERCIIKPNSVTQCKNCLRFNHINLHCHIFPRSW